MLEKKNKAAYNRTIQIDSSEIEDYKKRAVKLTAKASFSKIKNKIINQNIFDVLEFFPEQFIDLLFVDPPYNLHKKFSSVSFREMSLKDYEIWTDSWLSKMVRLLKPNASIYICGDWKCSPAIYNSIKKYFKIQNRITWEREKGRGAKKNWKNCSEDIWFCTVSEKYTFNINDVKIRRKVLAPYTDENGKPKDWNKNGSDNFRITFPSNIWNDITIPFWSMPENTDHPTQKPEKLLAKIILASSNKGDLVFDPFLGSGTTAVTAKKLDRNFSGIEVDETFCAIAEKRLELSEKDNSIQGFENGIFWERNSLASQKEKGKSKKEIRRGGSNSNPPEADQISNLFTSGEK